MEGGTPMELLALIESPGHVCSRYRIEAFKPILKRFGVRLTIEAIESNALRRFAQMRSAHLYDSVILQRKLLDSMSFSILRRAARNLVFDFDDAVLYRDSYSLKGPYSEKRKARFERIVSNADTVLAGNSFLASRAEMHGAKPEAVHFMPTCIPLAQYESAKRAEKPDRNDSFVMVWIGSSSTLKGLEATSKIWNSIGEAVPNAVLRVVCDRFPKFKSLRVEPISWSQSIEIDQIVSADIGISHVPDDLWSRGKCGLKVLQYLAGGLPVLTNPVGVHAEMVKSGETGFLVDKTREWVEAIRWLSDNCQSRIEMGHNAIETIRQGYDVADWGLHFVDRVMPGAVPSNSLDQSDANSYSSGALKKLGGWKLDHKSNQMGLSSGNHWQVGKTGGVRP